MTTQDSQWVPEIHHRIQVILAEIESTRAWGRAAGFSEQQIASMVDGYNQTLEGLYTSDLQLARLLDDSDLVVGVQGDEAKFTGSPISVITDLLENTKRQIISVARSLNEAAGKKFPKSFEPTFVGIAPGSIYVGVNAPKSNEQPGTLFGEQDPLIDSVRTALKSIGIVSRLISENQDIDEIAIAIPDPVLRDATLRAVQSFAPRARSGIDKVIIAGRSVPHSKLPAREQSNVTLTVNNREQAKEMVKKPRKTSQHRTFIGEVREIDLDQRRFDVRRVEFNGLYISIKCVYEEKFDVLANRWLDQIVVVSGTTEENSEGMPRLLYVDSVRVEANRNSSNALFN